MRSVTRTAFPYILIIGLSAAQKNTTLAMDRDVANSDDGQCQNSNQKDKKFSCRDRCGYVNEYGCTCDFYCYIYSSCCYDFEWQCPDIHRQAVDRFGLRSPLTFCSDSSNVRVVADCLAEADSVDRHLCQQSEFRPVTYSDTGLNFKNIECLKCSGLDEDLALGWHQEVLVPFYQLSKLKRDFSLLKNIQAKWMSKDRTQGVRFCSASTVKTCPVETSSYLTEKCNNLLADFQINVQGKFKYYQNQYCARCNIKNETFDCYFHNIWPNNPGLKILVQPIRNDKIRITIPVNSPYMWTERECTKEPDGSLSNCTDTKCNKHGSFLGGICKFTKCMVFRVTTELRNLDRIRSANFDDFFQLGKISSAYYYWGMQLVSGNGTVTRVERFLIHEFFPEEETMELRKETKKDFGRFANESNFYGRSTMCMQLQTAYCSNNETCEVIDGEAYIYYNGSYCICLTITWMILVVQFIVY